MTNDFSCNKVYVASALFDQHPKFAKNLVNIFAVSNINWGIIPQTKTIWTDWNDWSNDDKMTGPITGLLTG